jgi:glycerol-3-phosphate cytidylyltransferase
VIVLTLGTFDLFHRGHVRLLARCRALAGLGGIVVVALNPDDFVAQFKGRAPVVPLADRMEVVRSCRYVDRVIVGSGRDSTDAIEDVGPDIIAIGDDWKERDYLGQLGVTQEYLDERRIRIVYLPYTQGVSSSQIRTAL